MQRIEAEVRSSTGSVVEGEVEGEVEGSEVATREQPPSRLSALEMLRMLESGGDDFEEMLERSIDNDDEQNENAENNEFNGPEVMCYDDAAIKRETFRAVLEFNFEEWRDYERLRYLFDTINFFEEIKRSKKKEALKKRKERRQMLRDDTPASTN